MRPAILLQHLLPARLMSGLINAATRVRWRPWKNLLIRTIAKRYQVAMDEARSPNPDDYAHFNAFFTRELKPGARPLDTDPLALLSPVDGAVSAAGPLQGDQVLQAKGHHYSLAALLGDPALAEAYAGGSFATLYLSPRDYHRIHMPCAGTLRRTLHVPGRLFSVAPFTVEGIPGLFARNERLVCEFEGDQGRFILILVGAVLVSSIETVWHGLHTPPYARQLQQRDYPQAGPGSVQLAIGQEMGRFNMGSTVILVFPPGGPTLDALDPGHPLRMGQKVGHLRSAEPRP